MFLLVVVCGGSCESVLHRCEELDLDEGNLEGSHHMEISSE